MTDRVRVPGPARRTSYRDTWCGQVLADRVDADGPGRRLGAPPPRPRRADLHRPARPHRARPARLQPRRAPARRSSSRHRLRAEDVLSVAGQVVRRDPETVNPELPTGEFEVRVAEATLLADAETPPFEIEGFSGEVGEEMRLRHRYLDLRRERMRGGDRSCATRSPRRSASSSTARASSRSRRRC